MATPARWKGWRAAALWELWAAATTFLVLEFPTGAVVAGLAGFGLARRLGAWPEGAAGSLGGAGLIGVLIAVLNLHGGLAPLPWLIVGAILIAAGGAPLPIIARRAA